MHYLAVVDFAFPDKPSGSARVAWDIALAVREAGHDVTLVAYRNDSGQTPNVERIDGLRVVRLQKPDFSTWNPLRYSKIAAVATRAAERIDSRTPVDVAHVHTQVSGAGIVNGLSAGTRIITTVHSPISLEQRVNERGRGINVKLRLAVAGRILKRFERQLLVKSTAIHTLSSFTRDRLLELHDATLAKKIAVIPHWAKPPGRIVGCQEAKAALGWSPQKRALFTLRNHRPRYGLDVALRAAAPLLDNYDAHFYIGGDGPLRPTLEALSRQLGVQDRIHFLGRIPDEDLDLAYAAADLFVLPSVALECFGLIVLEALVHGCPVISTDAAALPEVVGRVLPDSVVPAGDVDALRNRLDAILSGDFPLDPRERLRSKVLDAYGREDIVAQLIELIEGVRN